MRLRARPGCRCCRTWRCSRRGRAASHRCCRPRCYAAASHAWRGRGHRPDRLCHWHRRSWRDGRGGCRLRCNRCHGLRRNRGLAGWRLARGRFPRRLLGGLACSGAFRGRLPCRCLLLRTGLSRCRLTRTRLFRAGATRACALGRLPTCALLPTRSRSHGLCSDSALLPHSTA